MVDEIGIPVEFAEAPPEPPSNTARPCQFEGCVEYFEPIGAGANFRKFCDTHQPPKREKKPKKDRAPRGVPGVTVNVGGAAKGAKGTGREKELAIVKERAEWLLTMVAMLTAMAGMEADAQDITKGKEAWAESVKMLASHEDWLRKIAQGGDASERAMAWLAFGVATLALATPILLRHKVLPEGLAEMISVTMPDLAPAAPPQPVAA